MTKDALADLKIQFENALLQSIERPKIFPGFRSARLDSAVSYALLGEGKRLRPLLVLSSARAISGSDVSVQLAMNAAIAVEYIHTYSLIHDDLPAMDNDDYRRGKLSVHKKFGEDLAILAGDSLQADAFFYLASSKNNPDKMCQELAHASGRHGLCAGQSEDLHQVNAQKSVEKIKNINFAKTAKLFEASCVLGALSVNAQKKEIENMRKWGQIFGECFQVRDDALDQNGLWSHFGKKNSQEFIEEKCTQLKSLQEKFSKSEVLGEIVKKIFFAR